MQITCIQTQYKIKNKKKLLTHQLGMTICLQLLCIPYVHARHCLLTLNYQFCYGQILPNWSIALEEIFSNPVNGITLFIVIPCLLSNSYRSAVALAHDFFDMAFSNVISTQVCFNTF